MKSHQHVTHQEPRRARALVNRSHQRIHPATFPPVVSVKSARNAVASTPKAAGRTEGGEKSTARNRHGVFSGFFKWPVYGAVWRRQGGREAWSTSTGQSVAWEAGRRGSRRRRRSDWLRARRRRPPAAQSDSGAPLGGGTEKKVARNEDEFTSGKRQVCREFVDTFCACFTDTKKFSFACGLDCF